MRLNTDNFLILHTSNNFLMKKFIFITIAAAFIFQGCNINKDLIFLTDEEFKYDTLPPIPDINIKISPNDYLDFKILSNDGFKLIDMTTSQGSGSGGNSSLFTTSNSVLFLVETDGLVNLPYLGRVKLDGLTLKEAEFKLEDMYKEFYVNPFVILSVKNNRVIVYPGEGGRAQVITLVNNNTTLLEALSLAGGISERGISKRIKLIRKNQDGIRKIFKIDLSTIEGIAQADVVVQANDIIYVDPAPRIATEVLSEISPIITILSSIFLLISISRLR
jgi:polysaccharide biosynthesis/export protein